MKVFFSFIFSCIATNHLLAADSLCVSSPDKKITLTVYYKSSITYTVQYDGKTVLYPSLIDLVPVNHPSLSEKIKLKSHTTKTIDDTIVSPVPEKRKIIRDNYNELTIHLQQPYTLLFRAYNDGVAYRIVTRFKDSLIIKNEKAVFAFEKGRKILLPLIDPGQRTDKFHTSFEELYQSKNDRQLNNTIICLLSCINRQR